MMKALLKYLDKRCSKCKTLIVDIMIKIKGL